MAGRIFARGLFARGAQLVEGRIFVQGLLCKGRCFWSVGFLCRVFLRNDEDDDDDDDDDDLDIKLWLSSKVAV